MDLPPIERVQAVEVGPYDTVVVTIREQITAEQADHLRGKLEEFFPANKILILAGDAELSVTR